MYSKITKSVVRFFLNKILELNTKIETMNSKMLILHEELDCKLLVLLSIQMFYDVIPLNLSMKWKMTTCKNKFWPSYLRYD